jgi:hypothetical protein
MGQWGYRTTNSCPRLQVEVSGQFHRPMERASDTHWRLGGPQNRSGRCGEERILCPWRESKTDPWLSCPKFNHWVKCRYVVTFYCDWNLHGSPRHPEVNKCPHTVVHRHVAKQRRRNKETTLVARQQIPNKHKRTNWEALSSTRSMWQLRDARVELLEAVFSMWSAPRLYHSTDRVGFS